MLIGHNGRFEAAPGGRPVPAGCYTSRMEAKAELLALIDRMTEDEVLDLIDFIDNKNDPDELTPEEMAELADIEKEMAAGEYITFDELKAKYKL